MTKQSKNYSFHISEEQKGKRLDVFISEKITNLSRAQVKRLVQSENILVNAVKVKVSHCLRLGETVEVTIPPPQVLEVEAQEIGLEIIYEDQDFLAINKSAEMVVHPGPGNSQNTLVNAVLHHCQDLSGIGGKLRPGIVHRLDKGTSGIILVAKNDLSHQELARQFKDREVVKKYWALVWGEPKEKIGTIELSIGRSMSDRKKISPRSARVREAVTEYRVLKSFESISWLELCPKTGRTHQLRVHLSAIGHSIVGDPVYGKGFRRLQNLPSDLQTLVKKMPYQLLHAASLKFKHPRSGQPMFLEAQMRQEMQAFLCLINQCG